MARPPLVVFCPGDIPYSTESISLRSDLYFSMMAEESPGTLLAPGITTIPAYLAFSSNFDIPVTKSLPSAKST